MSEQNVEIVKKAYDCFFRGDIPGLLGLLTDDVSWRTPQVDGADFYGVKSGKEGATEFFKGLGTREASHNFEPREFFSAGDKVVVLGHWSATVVETGKSWKTDLVHTFTVRDGKISAFHEIFDNLAATRAFQKGASA
jgi:ketosteroid isomerase-like protein